MKLTHRKLKNSKIAKFCQPSPVKGRPRSILNLSYRMIFFWPDFILMKLSLLMRFRLALKAFKNLFIFKLRKVKISPVLRSSNIVIISMHDHKLFLRVVVQTQTISSLKSRTTPVMPDRYQVKMDSYFCGRLKGKN